MDEDCTSAVAGLCYDVCAHAWEGHIGKIGFTGGVLMQVFSGVGLAQSEVGYRQ